MPESIVAGAGEEGGSMEEGGDKGGEGRGVRTRGRAGEAEEERMGKWEEWRGEGGEGKV